MLSPSVNGRSGVGQKALDTFSCRWGIGENRDLPLGCACGQMVSIQALTITQKLAWTSFQKRKLMNGIHSAAALACQAEANLVQIVKQKKDQTALSHFELLFRWRLLSRNPKDFWYLFYMEGLRRFWWKVGVNKWHFMMESELKRLTGALSVFLPIAIGQQLCLGVYNGQPISSKQAKIFFS